MQVLEGEGEGEGEVILYNTALPDNMSLRFTSVGSNVRVARSKARTSN